MEELIDKLKRSRGEALAALESASMTGEQRERLSQVASLTDEALLKMANESEVANEKTET